MLAVWGSTRGQPAGIPLFGERCRASTIKNDCMSKRKADFPALSACYRTAGYAVH